VGRGFEEENIDAAVVPHQRPRIAALGHPRILELVDEDRVVAEEVTPVAADSCHAPESARRETRVTGAVTAGAGPPLGGEGFQNDLAFILDDDLDGLRRILAPLSGDGG
jgi:hypothetical protein